ncbi:VCBS repeat-containing protein [Patescibacteria group bacterium]|nr:VCBS repeat-containing protein [Patescibacteria group bacterium]
MTKKSLSVLVACLVLATSFAVFKYAPNMHNMNNVDANASDEGVAQDTFLVFDDAESEYLYEHAREVIEQYDGHIKTVLEPYVVIASITESTKNELLAKGSVRAAYSSEINTDLIKQFGPDVGRYAEVWNAMHNSPSVHVEIEGNPDSPVREISDEKIKTTKENSHAKAPYKAGYYDTTEYMLGKISVAIILTESDGSLDPSTEDWTVAKEQQVQAEILSSLNWWETQSAKYIDQPITFIPHFYVPSSDSRVETQYEPINHSSLEDDTTWLPEVMNNFGYNSGDGYYADSYAFINNMRTQDKSDWGFVVFVADSENDVDNMFADGAFAYAFLGGPSVQMTYGNDGYTIDNMDAVLSHEIGHIFYALDQYLGAGDDCRLRAGYGFVANQNSTYNLDGGACALDEGSIMRGDTGPYIFEQIDQFARGQIGWMDADADKVADIYDVESQAVLDVAGVVNTKTPTFSGVSEVGIKTNANQYTDSYLSSGYTTIHSFLPVNSSNPDVLTASDYKIDGGDWVPTTLTDGTIDSGGEAFSVSFPAGLSKGGHTIHVRSTSQYGGVGAVSSYDFTVDPLPGAISDLKASRTKGNVALTWTNPVSEDFGGVKVLRRTDRFADGPDDGDVVYDGKANAYDDSSVTDTQKYYYSVFTYATYGSFVRDVWVVEVSGMEEAAGTKIQDQVLDRTPVSGSPSNFWARGGASEVKLTWNNPATFDKVYVVRKTGDEWAKDVNDGDRVYEGRDITTLDKSVRNGTKYTYTAYACNQAMECSKGVGASATPNQRLIVTGAGEGSSPYVETFEYSGKAVWKFMAYDKNMKHGVEVATGDLDGDGVDEIVTGTGDGGAPQIRVFDSRGKVKMTNGFYAYPKSFRTGVHVAVGDVDGDGKAEIITGPGKGGGPHVKIFDGKGKQKFSNAIFPYSKNFRGGVHVAAGDINNDGTEEIIAGAGSGGGPHVRVFNRNGKTELNGGFFAYGENYRGGVLVASADINRDGKDEIVTGTAMGGGPHVRTFNASGKPDFTPGFFPYSKKFRGGANVATFDLNGDNKAEIITGPGKGGGSQVRVFTRYGKPYLTSGFFSGSEKERNGIHVSAGSF